MFQTTNQECFEHILFINFGCRASISIIRHFLQSLRPNCKAPWANKDNLKSKEIRKFEELVHFKLVHFGLVDFDWFLTCAKSIKHLQNPPVVDRIGMATSKHRVNNSGLNASAWTPGKSHTSFLNGWFCWETVPRYIVDVFSIKFIGVSCRFLIQLWDNDWQNLV